MQMYAKNRMKKNVSMKRAGIKHREEMGLATRSKTFNIKKSLLVQQVNQHKLFYMKNIFSSSLRF